MNEGAKKALDGSLVRRNYGKNHGYQINRQKADGVTSILSGSIPKGALVGWAAGAVGAFVFDEPAETVQLAQRLGREAFIAAMKEVPMTDRDKAAHRGTEVHKLAELAGLGEEVEVPDELSGHFDSYVNFRFG